MQVFLAIADTLTIAERERSLKMMNRALSFSDPEDLETLDQITSRIKVLRGDALKK